MPPCTNSCQQDHRVVGALGDKLWILVFDEFEFSDDNPGMMQSQMDAVRDSFAADLKKGPPWVTSLPAGVTVCKVDLA